jgi:Protein of unknown function (DUF2844)
MRSTIRLLLLWCTIISVPAYAALGDDESTVSTDAAVSRMELRAMAPSATHFRVHELRDTARNLRVREYVNQDGKVFGVAWDGPIKPDLSQVLGPYFTRYRDASAGHGMARQLRRIDQPDFVLRVSGHMRHFTGAAWVPALVPANVDPTEVK